MPGYFQNLGRVAAHVARLPVVLLLIGTVLGLGLVLAGYLPSR